MTPNRPTCRTNSPGWIRILRALALLSAVFPQMACLPQMTWASEPAWPRLADGYPRSGICATALEIANSAYRSDSFYLYAPPTVAKESGVVLALQPSAVDISGGDALIADQAVFQKIPRQRVARNIYWQTKARYGLRYVMNEEPLGWQGDRYTLYALKDDVTPDRFIEGVHIDAAEQAFDPLIAEGWRPPLLLQDQRTGDVWAIDVGPPYVFLSDWSIYSIGPDGAKLRCVIHFHPRVNIATALLPRSVQILAHDLDATLGSGADEGTLHPTARIRVAVSHTWANAALRPWAALTAQPYNSRKQVDAELKAYRGKGARFRKAYGHIYADYPRAERALTRYYQAKLGKNASEAGALAKRVMDLAFRQYFSFPKSGDD
jgi:hypothetical protein